MRDPVVRAAFQDSATWAAGDQVVGPRKRAAGDLSPQQVPELLATARGGATAGQVLETVSQASWQAALAAVLASELVLLSDGGRAYLGCARQLGVQHEAVNVSKGVRVRGSYPIQTLNNPHQQWKAFLGPFRGSRRTYLDSYLRWFQQAGVHEVESSQAL